MDGDCGIFIESTLSKNLNDVNIHSKLVTPRFTGEDIHLLRPKLSKDSWENGKLF